MNKRRVSVVFIRVWLFFCFVLGVCLFVWRGVFVRKVGKSSPCFLFCDSGIKFKNTNENQLCAKLSTRDFWRNK